MAGFKKGVVLCLALVVSSTEAADLSDPIFCYILDGFLMIYSIIFTALYFKTKISNSNSQRANASAAQQNENPYEALSTPTSDFYQELQVSNQPRKSKAKTKEGRKSKPSDAIEMESGPALPKRK